MKTETKRKILKFVKRILKYSDKTQAAMSTHLYPEQEFKMLDEHQIQFHLNLPLIDALMEGGAIKYTEKKHPDGVLVKAEVYFIKKKS